MILVKYISEILAQKDILIIYDLGTITKSSMPAKVDKENNVVIPPYLCYSFNEFLKYKDIDLIQFIINKEEVDKETAEQLIETYVAEFKEELIKDEVIEIEHVGRFTYKNEKIGFETFEIRNEAEHYGLNEIEIKPISKEAIKKPEIIEKAEEPVQETEKIKAPEQPEEIAPIHKIEKKVEAPIKQEEPKEEPAPVPNEPKEQIEEEKATSIKEEIKNLIEEVIDKKEDRNKENTENEPTLEEELKEEEEIKKGILASVKILISIVVIILLSIVMLFVFSRKSFDKMADLIGIETAATPEEDLSLEPVYTDSTAYADETNEQLEIDTTDTSFMTEPVAEEPEQVVKEEVKEKNVVAEKKKEAPAPKTTTENTEVSTGVKRYYVVGGSFGVESNATKLKKQLEANGYPAVVIPYKNMHTVAYGAYNSMDEAKKMMETVQQKENKQVWILKY